MCLVHHAPEHTAEPDRALGLLVVVQAPAQGGGDVLVEREQLPQLTAGPAGVAGRGQHPHPARHVIGERVHGGVDHTPLAQPLAAKARTVTSIRYQVDGPRCSTAISDASTSA